MRAVFGLLVVMLGLAMAIVWMPEHDSQRQLAVVTSIATQGLPRRQEPGERNGRTFSPNTPLIATVEMPGSGLPQHVAGAARVVRTGAGGEPAAASVVVQAPVAGTSGVTPSLKVATVVTPSTSEAAASATRATPVSETSRYDLVRNIQRELKRVGCYAGDVDGDWGAGSRRAMAAFTDRVNASLPIEQPDFILLTLVQGHQSGICGKGCPTGMTSDNGRCVPAAVVAQARRSQDRRNPSYSNDVVHYTTTQTATAPAPQDTGWSTQIVRSGTAAAGPSPSAPAAIAGAVAVASAVAPLPGRMSIGVREGVPGSVAISPNDRSLAREVVRLQPPMIDDGNLRPPLVAEKRDRPRRAARGGSRFSASGFRAPRFSGPVYYASAPRRGRTWTGSFFGFP